MNRIVWVVGLAAWAFIGTAAPVGASPLQLRISGGASGVRLPSDPLVFDVSDGFSGFTRDAIWGIGDASDWPSDLWDRSLTREGDIRLTAFLYEGEGSRPLASVALIGAVEEYYYRPWGLDYTSIKGQVKGSAFAGPVDVAPGIDPSLIPSWFSNLSATVHGRTSGAPGGINGTLTVTAAPVPEPGSVLVFLAAAGGGLVALRRRRA